MSLTIAEIRASDVRPCSVDIKGSSLPFTYTPNAFTPELEEITLDPESGEFKLNSPTVRAMLAALIVDIDLTEDAPKSVIDEKSGKPRAYDPKKDPPLKRFPVEVSLKILPNHILLAMLMEVIEDLNPKSPSDAPLSVS